MLGFPKTEKSKYSNTQSHLINLCWCISATYQIRDSYAWTHNCRLDVYLV